MSLHVPDRLEPCDPPDPQRRTLLGALAAAPLSTGSLAGAALLAAAPAVQAAVPTNVVTVLYRRESAQAPSRLEPVIQSATLALEAEFVNRGFRVVQPTAEVYKLLDQGQGVIITFAEDAGFSLVFSAYADVRPAPGQDAGIAEVRLATRVYVGRHILVAEEGRGQMFTRLEPSNREFGMRRGLELAARRAAADVADKAARQLQALSPERINQMVGAKPSSVTTAQVVAVPAPGAVPALPGDVAPGVPGAPPPLAPTTPALAAAPVAPPGLPPAAVAVAPPAMPGRVPVPVPVLPVTPATAVAADLAEPKQRWALVIGMSDYSSVRAATGSTISDLPGVARDTSFVVDSLAKLGFAKERTAILRDRQATGTAIRGVLKQLAGKVGDDDVVVIFISAHGADKDEGASGFGMPILADFKPRDAAALDFWEMQSFAKNLRGRVMWINDTCHSGGAAKDVASVVVSGSGVTASKDVRGPDAQVVAGGAGPGQDFAILTACGPNEISWETSEGGLFTTKLFRELVASGGRVPVASLYAERVQGHVVQQSRRMCNTGNLCGQYPQQTPIMAYNGRGNQIRI